MPAVGRRHAPSNIDTRIPRYQRFSLDLPTATNTGHHLQKEVETGIEPVCTALQAVASPLGHSTAGVDATAPFERMTGFEPATLTLAR